MRHHLFQFWIVIIILTICGLLATIPYEKYQNQYFNFIEKFNSIPQEHLNRQIDYANQSGYVDIQIFKRKTFINQKQNPEQTQARKPYYIRDINNPKILYPYNH